MLQSIQHTAFVFCWWDLPALIVLIGVIAYSAARWAKMKQAQEDMEDELSMLYAEDSTKEGLAGSDGLSRDGSG